MRVQDHRYHCLKFLFSASRASLLKGTLSGLLCTSIMANSASAASQLLANDTAMSPASKASSKRISAKKPTKKVTQALPRSGPVYRDAPVVAVPIIPPCSAESAAALDKKYNLKGWEIRPPSFGNSLTQDRGCWRTDLAKLGFSFLGYNVGIIETNMLNHYVPPSNTLVYVGQRPFADMHTNGYLLYDLSRYGIPDGQIQLGFFEGQSTWIAAVPNNFNFSQIGYYQSFFDKALEFNIGYLGLDKQFMGIQVGGNIANVLGPGGNLYAEVGGSNDGDPTPAATLRWNIANGFYNKAAIQRSIASTVAGASGLSFFEVEHYSNPLSIKFTNTPYVRGIKYPTERPLLIDELGYKHDAAPGQLYTWIRVTGMYNTTLYENLQNTRLQATNGGVFVNADQQLWQSEPGSAATAYKGLYVGATANYISKTVNPTYEEFGARIYTFGLFNRPKDTINFTWDHQVINPYIADPVDMSAICHTGVECIHHAVNTYTMYYNASVMPGVNFLLGAAYVDHASQFYSPNALRYGSTAAPVLPYLNVRNSLTFLAATFINF